MIYYLGIFLIYCFPTLWAKYTFSKYDEVLKNMPFTGLDFGNTILKEKGLNEVTIQGKKNIADHYNLDTKTVVVELERLERKSLTSITVICHEIGHAIQHKEQYKPLMQKHTTISVTKWISKLGSLVFYIGIPTIIATQSFPFIRICLLIAFISVLINIVIHLFTLNVEFDASFQRAMPILQNKIPSQYHKTCKTILRVCAFTYVIGAMTSFLNIRNIWILLRMILFRR